ncbi:Hydroquinone glucosyltransferase-like protein [Drosera capensis]
MAPTDNSPHIIFFPSPGMGHLIPLINFATHLLHHYPRLSLTFVVPSSAAPTPPQLAALAALPSSVTSLFLDPVEDLPSNLAIESIISYTLLASLPGLRDVIRDRIDGVETVTALVVDLFGTDAMDVAAEFGVRSYIFYPTTAMCLALFKQLPEMDETVECEYREMSEPVRLKGCVPVHGGDLLDPVQDRENEAYKWVLHHAKRYELAGGILVNTFEELEGGALRGLREDVGWPSVYPVGPLVQSVGTKNEEVVGQRGKECLTWLDGQAPGSVLFVSFGSGGTLSWDQINELALGLEMSEQRFLWVARSPNNRTTSATFFNAGSQEVNPLGFLPEGFVGRTHGRGLVVSSWAPQIHVLAHGSTGGFLTHCGWNSTLESVVHGVPLIAWPLYAEQKMNAVMLVDGLKVALRPKAGEGGLIGREEIARVARALMEGEEGKDLRARMRDLKYAAAKALSDDGSSIKALDAVVKKWTSSHAQ